MTIAAHIELSAPKRPPTSARNPAKP